MKIRALYDTDLLKIIKRKNVNPYFPLLEEFFAYTYIYIKEANVFHIHELFAVVQSRVNDVIFGSHKQLTENGSELFLIA